ncbi:PREDICTED: transmembrane protein 18-like [Amphimedon queenslandica]|uniref:Uncharacterized protein n=1 Tax=Amphimedon queenslandica TaxID=400682 RepID=A0A1X7UBX7_AMPQE|nr:PREDICTED: transmembrane protein 18-like [Amphimedon queenslandica]|eukprot:XP_003388467.1 PREDICTED: transmembrane protein 18-like [Amphimedon queenslandica]
MVAPTVEVVGADMLQEDRDISTDVGLLLAVISKVNWSEPFLIAVIIFHLLCLVCILVCRRRPYLLSAILLILGLVCFAGEYINEWAAANSHQFLSEQYFDSTGVFISLILSIPLLLECFVILICLFVESCSIMQQIAVAKMKGSKAKNDKKQK